MIQSETFVKLVKLMREDYETLGYRSQNFLNAQNTILEKGFSFEIAHLINSCGRKENDIMVEPYVEVEKCIDKILQTDFRCAVDVLKFCNESQKQKLVENVVEILDTSRESLLESMYFSEFISKEQKEYLKQAAFNALNASFCTKLIKKGCSKQDFETALTILLDYTNNDGYLVDLIANTNVEFTDEQLNRIYNYLLNSEDKNELYTILTECDLSLETRKQFEQKLVKQCYLCEVMDVIRYYDKNDIDYLFLAKELCANKYVDIDEVLEVYELATTDTLQEICIKKLFELKPDTRRLSQVFYKESMSEKTRELAMNLIIKQFNEDDLSPRELASMMTNGIAQLESEEITKLAVLIAKSEDEIATRCLIFGGELTSKQKQLVCKCVNDWEDENKKKLVRDYTKLTPKEKKLIKIKEETKTIGEQIEEFLKTID